MKVRQARQKSGTDRCDVRFCDCERPLRSNSNVAGGSTADRFPHLSQLGQLRPLAATTQISGERSFIEMCFFPGCTTISSQAGTSLESAAFCKRSDTIPEK